jgi:hypothetical protein
LSSLTAKEARALGESLRRVKPELIKPLPTGERLWWVGEERYFEATAHLDDEGAMVWFEISLRGREVRLERGLKTADTGEMSVDNAGMPASKLVTDDAEPDERLIEDVIAVLRAADDEALGERRGV